MKYETVIEDRDGYYQRQVPHATRSKISKNSIHGLTISDIPAVFITGQIALSED